MKTQTRRFLSALFALVIIIATLAIPAKSWSQGVVSFTNITVTATLGPVVATQQFINDTTNALMNGFTSYGLFNAIPSGSSMNISNIFCNGNVGNAIYFTLAISSSDPFTLAQIGYNATSPSFLPYTGTLGSAGVTYTGQGVGINETNSYVSGNQNTLIYSAFIIGWKYSINITGSTVEEQLQNQAPFCPYNVNVNYSLGASSGSAYIVNTVMPVPEPSIMVLSIFGLLLFPAIRKDK